MTTLMLSTLLRSRGRLIGQQVRFINYYDWKWREDTKRPRNPNSFGPLTNLPDYSFKDGRPVPFGCNQKKRMDKQKEHLVRIKKLVGEVDMAVLNHQQRLEMIEKEKQQIIASKLKEKGSKLLSSGAQDQVCTNK